MAVIIFYHHIPGYLSHTSHHTVLRKWYKNEWINEEKLIPTNRLTSKILISSILPFDLYHFLIYFNSPTPTNLQSPRGLHFVDAAALIFFVSLFPWSSAEIALFSDTLSSLAPFSHHNVSLTWQNPNHLPTCFLHPNSRRLLEKTHISVSVLTLILGLQTLDGHSTLESPITFL